MGAVTLAPPLVLPVLPPVLPLTAPVNLASNSSCLLGSRLCSSSIGPETRTSFVNVSLQTTSIEEEGNPEEDACEKGQTVSGGVMGRKRDRLGDKNRKMDLTVQKVAR